MTFSYDPTLADKVSEVRFKLGDTVSTAVLLQDEEIQAKLNKNSDDIIRTAADCAEFIASLFGRDVHTTVGPVAFRQLQARAQFWNNRAMELRKEAQSLSQGPISTQPEDQKPEFEVGMHDFPQTTDVDRLNDPII